MKNTITILCLIFLAGCQTPPEAELGSEGPEGSEGIGYDVQIRWTSYGIPHVKAGNWASLGYGFAYATATDAFCVIAHEVMLVAGEQSRYQGPEDGRLESDIFHKAMLETKVLDHFSSALSSNSADFNEGFVKGYNRYLKDNRHSLPAACADKPWVRPIDLTDVIRMNVGVGIRYGVGRFKQGIADAQPPGAEVAYSPADFSRFGGIGSNAVALGRGVTESGRGMLFGNPHYPWKGPSRFHMIHTTIPGELDVMGVGLMTTTRVSIGFNKDIAWTHTVSTALRATVYELSLNPDNAMQYLYNGEYRDIEKTEIKLTSINAEGQASELVRTVFTTHFGPIAASKELPWTAQRAYVIKDANVYNNRSSETYDALGQARNIDEVEAALSHQGVAFTNTIAADRDGTAFYADISVTPNVDADLLERCRVAVEGVPAYLVILNGSRSDCEWVEDTRARIPGILPADEMPRLRRDDYVTNSNNSYWLSNPHAPLEGYSPIIGPEQTVRSLRTRAGITLVEALIAKGKVKPSDLQAMLYAHRNYGAELLLDDVLRLCESDGRNADIDGACAALSAWDRTMTVDSHGSQVWTEFWTIARKIDGIYAQAFDKDDPVNTPRGVAVDNPEVKAAVVDALLAAQTRLDKAGIALDQRLGDIQYTELNGKHVAIPGGQGWAGMFSMIVAPLKDGAGYTPIVHGNSFIQVISWDKEGELDARGILTYSQSQEPESAHYSDQTELYSTGQWLKFPFKDADIAADPNLVTLHLSE